MSSETFEKITSGIESIATTLALLVAGAWAAWRYLLKREGVAKVEFRVAVRAVGILDDAVVTEICATLINKGAAKLAVTAKNFTFDVRALNEADPLDETIDEINKQLRFPDEVKAGTWLPASWENTWIEPGLEQTYSHVLTIPISARFVLLHARFDYGSPAKPTQEYHTADCVVDMTAACAGISGQEKRASTHLAPSTSAKPVPASPAASPEPSKARTEEQAGSVAEETDAGGEAVLPEDGPPSGSTPE